MLLPSAGNSYVHSSRKVMQDFHCNENTSRLLSCSHLILICDIVMSKHANSESIFTKLHATNREKKYTGDVSREY